jgi:iron complex transport system substrate-binding protein
MLCDLGMKDRIVGVSRFCKDNVEAVKDKGKGKAGQTPIPQVGGYHDPNFESILRLRPDLTLILTEHEKSMPGLKILGIPTLVLCHQNVSGCIESIRSIGAACGEEQAGNRMADKMQSRLDRIRRKTAGCKRPRVMICIDRTKTPSRLADICIAGSDGYYSEMIDCAGGVNVYQKGKVRYPTVSSEVIMRLNPEVVVDLVDGLSSSKSTTESTLRDWQQLSGVSAVKERRVFAFEKSATVPGLKIVKTIEDLARVLHPEIAWDEP